LTKPHIRREVDVAANTPFGALGFVASRGLRKAGCSYPMEDAFGFQKGGGSYPTEDAFDFRGGEAGEYFGLPYDEASLKIDVWTSKGSGFRSGLLTPGEFASELVERRRR